MIRIRQAGLAVVALLLLAPVALAAAPPDLVAPSVTLTPLSTSSIRLNWTDPNSNENGYQVERSTNGSTFSLVTTTGASVVTYTNSGLTSSTRYYYRVRAFRSGNKFSPYSAVVNAATFDVTAPSVPTNVRATAISCGSVSITWNASADSGTGASGVRGYKLYRNGAWVKDVLAPATSTTDTGRSQLTTYLYTVAAFDYSNNLSLQSSPASSVTTPACTATTTTTTPSSSSTTTTLRDTTKPSTPSGFSVTAVSCSQINLSWSASTDTGGSGLWGYWVYRGGAYLKSVPAPSTSTSDTGLSANTQYSYAVLAVDGAGNLSSLSVTRSATTPSCTGGTTTTTVTAITTTTAAATTTTTLAPADTTPPSVPTGVTATATSCSQMYVSWSPSSDAQSYVSYYSVYRNSAFLRNVTTTNTTDTGLAASTVYSYRVSATNRDGYTSAQSAIASGNTPACATGSGQVTWRRRGGGTSADYGITADTDASGNVIVAGRFSGTADFGGGALTSAGSQDLVVAKYTAAGSHVWSRRYGSTGTEYANGVAVDGSGNVVVVGMFTGTSDLGMGARTSVAGWDLFVAKYTSAGAPVWVQTIGSVRDDFGYGVALEADGDVVVVGSWEYGGVNRYLGRLAGATGAVAWMHQPISASVPTGRGVAVDGLGNMLVTGSFQGGVDFGGGLILGVDLNDVFLLKLTASGAHVWSKGLGSPQEDIGYGVAVDGSNNVVVTGTFAGGLNFGGGVLNGTLPADVFVAKYTAAGSHVWSRRMGGTAYDEAGAVTTDGSGNVAVTLTFQGTADLGGGALTSAGMQDVGVARYTAAGSHLWSRRYGGASDDYARGVAVDGNANVTALGYFRDTADFGGQTLTSAGSLDLFVLQIAP